MDGLDGFDGFVGLDGLDWIGLDGLDPTEKSSPTRAPAVLEIGVPISNSSFLCLKLYIWENTTNSGKYYEQ